MGKRYLPSPGDVVWVDFNPQSGHEPAGRRPALVVSPLDYNAKVGLMLCCPIAHQVKAYPFEVEVRGVPGLSGVVLADQVKSMDWVARRAAFKARALPETLAETMAKIRSLLDES
ncbi:MAG: endoribonuclease MazF [Betaproteobacteria bacterium]|nr:endoribonuclease MazF [Betaproteobacteria bacterium]